MEGGNINEDDPWVQVERLIVTQLLFEDIEKLYCPCARGNRPAGREASAVSVLLPMCRKSRLPEHIYDAGFRKITNIDCSKEVISDMLKRNVRERPEMKWRVMDSTDMQFANETFDAVVDNGGWDMLVITASSLEFKYLFQVKRVLKVGGKYICLTLAEPLMLGLLLQVFRFGWGMYMYPIGQEEDPQLQTFMVVAQKLASPEDVYDITARTCRRFMQNDSNKARDLSEVLQREITNRLRFMYGTDIQYSLEDLQLGAKGNIARLVPGRRVKLIIGFYYNGVLLDAKDDPGSFTHPFAVFLVPQNRAQEWKYSSEEGQWLIVKNSKASRLLMILLDSSSSHLSMDAIERELDSLVNPLIPEDCGEGYQIPYLKTSNKINKRKIVYQGSSVLTGSIVVEDVIYKDEDIIYDDYKGCTFRRLIFNRNDSVVQSEALLSIKESNRISTDVGKDKKQQASKHKKKGKQRKSDSKSSRQHVSSGEVKVVHNHLVSRYHRGIVFGIGLIPSFLKVSTSARGLVNTVVIGLGGGLLPMFLRNYLPSLKIEVVELDCKVLHFARDYFGFSDDESLKVYITDGIKFVKEKADGNSSCKIDILVVDVNSSDSSSALTSPAKDFVDESFLLTVKDLLSEQGLFIINLVSRSSAEKNKVHSKLKKVFSCILSLPIEEDINEVLFALKTTGSTIKEGQLSEACNEFAKSLEHEKKWTEEDVGLPKLIKLLN